MHRAASEAPRQAPNRGRALVVPMGPHRAGLLSQARRTWSAAFGSGRRSVFEPWNRVSRPRRFAHLRPCVSDILRKRRMQDRAIRETVTANFNSHSPRRRSAGGKATPSGWRAPAAAHRRLKRGGIRDGSNRTTPRQAASFASKGKPGVTARGSRLHAQQIVVSRL